MAASIPRYQYRNYKTLFDLSAQFCDRNELNKLIVLRCEQLNEQLTTHTADSESINSKVIFWFVRAFFFLDEMEIEPYWNYLKLQEKSYLF